MFLKFTRDDGTKVRLRADRIVRYQPVRGHALGVAHQLAHTSILTADSDVLIYVQEPAEAIDAAYDVRSVAKAAADVRRDAAVRGVPAPELAGAVA